MYGHHYNTDFLEVGKPFPPEEDLGRLNDYSNNKLLYEGELEKVLHLDAEIDFNSINYTIVTNFYNRLARVWKSFILREPFALSVGSTEDDASNLGSLLEVYQEDNDLVDLVGKAIIDIIRYGTSVVRIRLDGNSTPVVDPIDITKWYPIVDEYNKNRAIGHSIVHSYKEEGKFGRGTKEYILVETHTPGFIRNKLFELKNGVIYRELALDSYHKTEGIQPEVQTNIDYCLVQAINLDNTSDCYFGRDGYRDIDSFITAKIQSLTGINKVLAKYGEPTPVVPMSMLSAMEQGEYYIDMKKAWVYSEGEERPSYVSFDGKLENHFAYLDILDKEIYIATETSPTMFGDTKNGLAESGSAMKRLMTAPIGKAERLRTALSKFIRGIVLALNSLDNVYNRVPRLNSVIVNWQDVLSDDYSEMVSRQERQYSAGLLSLERALEEQGLSGEELELEIQRLSKKPDDILLNIQNPEL